MSCIGTSIMLASQFMHMSACVTGKGSFGLFQLRRSLGFKIMAFTKKTLTLLDNYIALIHDFSLDTFQLPTENIYIYAVVNHDITTVCTIHHY